MSVLVTYYSVLIIKPVVWTRIVRSLYKTSHLIFIKIYQTYIAVTFIIINIIGTCLTISNCLHYIKLPYVRGASPCYSILILPSKPLLESSGTSADFLSLSSPPSTETILHLPTNFCSCAILTAPSSSSALLS